MQKHPVDWFYVYPGYNVKRLPFRGSLHYYTLFIMLLISSVA